MCQDIIFYIKLLKYLINSPFKLALSLPYKKSKKFIFIMDKDKVIGVDGKPTNARYVYFENLVLSSCEVIFVELIIMLFGVF